MTELWLRNKTAGAPFETPESKGRGGESCLNPLQLGLEVTGQISEIHHFLDSITFYTTDWDSSWGLVICACGGGDVLTSLLWG